LHTLKIKSVFSFLFLCWIKLIQINSVKQSIDCFFGFQRKRILMNLVKSLINLRSFFENLPLPLLVYCVVMPFHIYSGPHISDLSRSSKDLLPKEVTASFDSLRVHLSDVFIHLPSAIDSLNVPLEKSGSISRSRTESLFVVAKLILARLLIVFLEFLLSFSTLFWSCIGFLFQYTNLIPGVDASHFSLLLNIICTCNVTETILYQVFFELILFQSLNCLTALRCTPAEMPLFIHLISSPQFRVVYATLTQDRSFTNLCVLVFSQFLFFVALKGGDARFAYYAGVSGITRFLHKTGVVLPLLCSLGELLINLLEVAFCFNSFF
jgi:hypothetical protein